MRKLSFLIVIILIIGGFYSGLTVAAAGQTWSEQEIIALDIPVTQMLAEPTAEASANFIFPIDLKILSMTPDHNWFKVRIAYTLPLVGHFEYSGWCYVPLGEKFFSLEK